MEENSFSEFLDALRAFESGWDRPRYEAGIIADWQLDQWAGGTVADYFPQYSSWGDLTDAEWDAMSYRSMNSLGFVGYQFGEALLIDLGYYDDDVYYGNGAASNTWDGTWTGKNGATSLEAFMTAEVQNQAIRDAFGYNLQVIENGLAQQGLSLADFIGTTGSYVSGGQTVTVDLTLTGILAAAHLRGAWGMLTLLQGGGVSSDEYGTSILQYIEQFGGFDSPTVSELIAAWEDGKTGDEGLGTPDGSAGGGGGSNDGGNDGSNDGSGGGSSGGGLGGADVTESTATVVINWSWGSATTVPFDPATDTIFVSWISADVLDVTETAAGVVIALPSNNQSTTLAGVTLADLSPSNFTFLDQSAADEVFSQIGTDTGGNGGNGDGGNGGTGDGGNGGTGDGGDHGTGDDGNGDTGDGGDHGTGDGGNGDTGDGGGGHGGTGDDGDGGTGDDGHGGGTYTGGGLGTANVNEATATVAINWAWGTSNTVPFDPATDTIFVSWISADVLEVTETAAGVVIALPSNNQSTTLAGVTLAELSASNFTFLDQSAADEVFSLIGDPSHAHHGHLAITLTSPSQTVTDFDPSTGMIHIEGGITAERLTIYEDNMGAGPRLTIVVLDDNGAPLSQTTLVGVSIGDLGLGHFSIAEPSALDAVAELLGETIETPDGGGGFDIVDDTDGSSPPATSGTTDNGGVRYVGTPFADDIVGFDPERDEIDLGITSVHNLIFSKTPSGEVAIDDPWSDAVQILQDISFTDLSVENFGVVGNEHLRQDLGGVLSWELGVGPRDADTVYIRSHEYNRAEVIDDFDPATDKISFLYFGTRERLTVEDTDDGLVISVLPSGQSFTFTGLSLSDLVPGQVEFHNDQVIEDNLEVPFGFDQSDVTLVDRTMLLTPEGPAGQITDGHQTRDGLFGDGSGSSTDSGSTDAGGTDTSGDGNTGSGGTDTGITNEAGGTIFALDWNWAATETIDGFDPMRDTIDLGNFGPGNFDIDEAPDGDLVIEILNMGGQSYRFEGVGADDILPGTFTAPEWNTAALAAAEDDLASLI